MKLLVIFEHSPKKRFLTNVADQKLIRKIKGLIARKRYSQAIAEALSNGGFEKEVAKHELSQTAAELILTEENAHWDIVK